jgi:serine/threonine protein kinase
MEAGEKLGPYEILSPIGAGGMGEVYRAKDTRLDRIVAIKILPVHLSTSSDFRQRFEREAKAVSILNHPNICTLHDIGQQNGTEYLVMEYIEGETLSSRLQKGPLPVTDLLRYSIQIADALDKAHKKGIVHRDLKPGNIILTKSGVKVLDFGLAKMADQKPASDVSQLATAQKELTKEGMILGTIQYMAPEQLEGRECDARTDIFAFGAVMYEMATAKKAFEGNSQASLIAAILKEEPKPITQSQPLSPPILDRLIKTCLAKDPEDRWQNAHDISNELRWMAESSASTVTSAIGPTPARSPHKLMNLGWIVAAALALMMIAGFIWMNPRYDTKAKSESGEVRFLIPSSNDLDLGGFLAGVPDFAVSHDGKRLIFTGRDSVGRIAIYLRTLDSLDARPIPNTENAEIPFWSPDDQKIAFSADGKLKVVNLNGGADQVLCDVPTTFYGGTWLQDGTIVYGQEYSGLMRVSENGGKSEPFTVLDSQRGERIHSYPVFLPDGRHFVFSADSNKSEDRTLYVSSIDSKEKSRLLNTRYKVNYLDPGYLLFLRGTSLWAQRLQMDPPKMLGDPVLVASGISPNAAVSNAPFTASANGTILYRGGDVWAKTQLAWFDRQGKTLATVGSIESDVSVTLSPDGTHAAVGGIAGNDFRSATGEPSINLWNIDLSRGIRTRVTVNPNISDENPTWSPDGRYLAFASHRESDRAEIFKKAASGAGQEQIVFSGAGNEHPIDWSSDGKFILVQFNGNQLDIAAVPVSGSNEKPIPYITSSTDDGQAQFSPDGRWVAYTSGESGRSEVYIRPFPNGDTKWQISSDGGSEPRWRGDGKELFYLTPDGTLMAVGLKTSTSFEAAPPVTLFKTKTLPIPLGAWGGAAQYDVSNDGSRFLINTIVVPSTPSNLYVIVNWNPPAEKK